MGAKVKSMSEKRKKYNYIEPTECSHKDAVDKAVDKKKPS